MGFLKKYARKIVAKDFNFIGDGFATRNKSIEAINERGLVQAYEWSARTEFDGRKPNWQKHDLRWRAHICVWAATQALKIEGDFVECGVDTAILSGVVIKQLDFARVPRKFWLFDTFNGIPLHPDMSARERGAAQGLNKIYFDCFEFVKQKFSGYPNVELVRGVLPESLEAIEGRKIAYLYVDLNNAPAESGVIERLWPQVSQGAIVVLDDYTQVGHEEQHEMWNAFAEKHGLMVAALPTGQGLLIKA
jgi:O-methyltransferase